MAMARKAVPPVAAPAIAGVGMEERGEEEEVYGWDAVEDVGR
jgi:hypothetical protein